MFEATRSAMGSGPEGAEDAGHNPSERAHKPNTTYYVQLRSHDDRSLFQGADDAAELSQLVASALCLCDAQLHAFCWTATEARFAVQVSSAPVGRFVQLVAGPYSRRVNRRLGRTGSIFRRYRAMPVMSGSDLLQLVRYIHWTPVTMGLVSDPAEYRWSSQRTYLGSVKHSWVTTTVVQQMLAIRYGPGSAGFSRWARERETHRDVLQFERMTLPAKRLRAPRGTVSASLDCVIDTVATRLDIPRAELLSGSRGRRATLGRALVLWHALRGGLGTLTGVSRVFSRRPSTLLVAMHRYSQSHADLFNAPLDTLPEQHLAGERWRNSGGC